MCFKKYRNVSKARRVVCRGSEVAKRNMALYLVRRRPRRIVYGGLKRRSKMTRQQQQHRRCWLVLRSRFHVNVVEPRNRRSWTGKSVMDSLAILEPLHRIGTRTSRCSCCYEQREGNFMVVGYTVGSLLCHLRINVCIRRQLRGSSSRGEPWLIELKHARLDFEEQESPSGRHVAISARRLCRFGRLEERETMILGSFGSFNKPEEIP